MSKKDVWLPLFVGDYLADTMRLTTQQHGAYLLLLMDYWRTGPLPGNASALAGIAKVDPKDWRLNVWPAIECYFSPDSDGKLRQKRMDAEIERTGRISKERQKAAQNRHNKDSKEDAKPLQTVCKTDANDPANDLQNDNKQDADCVEIDMQNGDIARGHALAPPSPSEKKEPPLIPPRGKRVRISQDDDDPEFLGFWNAYPRQVDKTRARKAWFGAIKRDAVPNIMAGLSRYQFSFDLQFIPLPATWLNNDRWRVAPIGTIEVEQPRMTGTW